MNYIAKGKLDTSPRQEARLLVLLQKYLCFQNGINLHSLISYCHKALALHVQISEMILNGKLPEELRWLAYRFLTLTAIHTKRAIIRIWALYCGICANAKLFFGSKRRLRFISCLKRNHLKHVKSTNSGAPVLLSFVDGNNPNISITLQSITAGSNIRRPSKFEDNLLAQNPINLEKSPPMRPSLIHSVLYVNSSENIRIDTNGNRSFAATLPESPPLSSIRNQTSVRFIDVTGNPMTTVASYDRMARPSVYSTSSLAPRQELTTPSFQRKLGRDFLAENPEEPPNSSTVFKSIIPSPHPAALHHKVDKSISQSDLFLSSTSMSNPLAKAFADDSDGLDQASIIVIHVRNFKLLSKYLNKFKFFTRKVRLCLLQRIASRHLHLKSSWKHRFMRRILRFLSARIVSKTDRQRAGRTFLQSSFSRFRNQLTIARTARIMREQRVGLKIRANSICRRALYRLYCPLLVHFWECLRSLYSQSVPTPEALQKAVLNCEWFRMRSSLQSLQTNAYVKKSAQEQRQYLVQLHSRTYLKRSLRRLSEQLRYEAEMRELLRSCVLHHNLRKVRRALRRWRGFYHSLGRKVYFSANDLQLSRAISALHRSRRSEWSRSRLGWREGDGDNESNEMQALDSLHKTLFVRAPLLRLSPARNANRESSGDLSKSVWVVERRGALGGTSSRDPVFRVFKSDSKADFLGQINSGTGSKSPSTSSLIPQRPLTGPQLVSRVRLCVSAALSRLFHDWLDNHRRCTNAKNRRKASTVVVRKRRIRAVWLCWQSVLWSCRWDRVRMYRRGLRGISRFYSKDRKEKGFPSPANHFHLSRVFTRWKKTSDGKKIVSGNHRRAEIVWYNRLKKYIRLWCQRINHKKNRKSIRLQIQRSIFLWWKLLLFQRRRRSYRKRICFHVWRNDVVQSLKGKFIFGLSKLHLRRSFTRLLAWTKDCNDKDRLFQDSLRRRLKVSCFRSWKLILSCNRFHNRSQSRHVLKTWTMYAHSRSVSTQSESRAVSFIEEFLLMRLWRRLLNRKGLRTLSLNRMRNALRNMLRRGWKIWRHFHLSRAVSSAMNRCSEKSLSSINKHRVDLDGGDASRRKRYHQMITSLYPQMLSGDLSQLAYERSILMSAWEKMRRNQLQRLRSRKAMGTSSQVYRQKYQRRALFVILRYSQRMRKTRECVTCFLMKRAIDTIRNIFNFKKSRIMLQKIAGKYHKSRVLMNSIRIWRRCARRSSLLKAKAESADVNYKLRVVMFAMIKMKLQIMV